jgi:hypothetical protein
MLNDLSAFKRDNVTMRMTANVPQTWRLKLILAENF